MSEPSGGRPRVRGATLVALLVLVAAAAGEGVRVSDVRLAGSGAALPGFVTTCGPTLCLDGVQWAMYAASDYGTSVTPTERARMASEAGLNTLRLVNFLDESGSPASAPFDEASWRDVDERIAAARRYGLKVLVDLSTYRNLLARAGSDPYGEDWGPFLRFVLDRQNTVTGVRYAEDPTIAMFSLAGEVEPEAGGTTVTEFFRRTLRQAEDIDPHHLWSTGGLLHLDRDSGIEWPTIMAMPENDVCSIHNYSEPDTVVTTPQIARFCGVLGKPWITEEFGFPQSVGDEERARRFHAMFDLQRLHRAAGVGFWNLGAEREPSSHDVNEQTPAVWQAVQANAPAHSTD
ncbi:hypothetical protein ACU61A_28260 [Pseudonocardia sichuanensis]